MCFTIVTGIKLYAGHAYDDVEYRLSRPGFTVKLFNKYGLE
jgi:hypothetical protein